MLYMEPYVPRLPCYHHTHSWAGEKRSRTRAIQLSAHRACLHGDEQCKKLFRAARTHETRNLAAPRRARPRPGRPASSSPRTPAHRARRCARTAAARPWGQRGRAPPRSGAAWASLSDGEAIPAGARPSLAPAIAMCGVRLMLMPRQLVSD